MFDSERLFVYLQILGEGAWLTIQLSVFAIVIGNVAGALLGACRASNIRLVKLVVGLFVELVRSIPVLVLLFLGYYGLPLVFGISMISPFWAAALVMTLHHGAYMAEIVRAGIIAVPIGQREAASALGLNFMQSMRWVVSPQALRIVIPPGTNQAIGTLKDTSLASVIGLTDLTNAGLRVRADSFSTWDVLGVVAAMYFVITFTVALTGGLLERRFNRFTKMRGIHPRASNLAPTGLVLLKPNDRLGSVEGIEQEQGRHV